MTALSEVGLLRLVAQQIAGPGLASPADVVRALAAMQGQDFPGAVTSVALRTSSRLRKDVVAALDGGEIVRSWPMRGTLHLVAAEDLPWLMGLLSPRVLAGSATRRARLDLTETDIERARDLVLGALSGGRRLRREALLSVLAEGGVATTGQRGYHLLWYLAQSGTLCLGPTEDGEQLFVLLDEWIPRPRVLEREEALGELARRFFRGHGPATLPDLVRWAGTTVRDARAGLAVARPHLASIDVDGTEHFLDPATPDRLADYRQEAGGLFLLPGFDEYVLGYADRSAVLEPAFFEHIVPGMNGMFRPTVVSGGRVVGTWQASGRGLRRTVTATPFTTFPEEVAAAIPEMFAALP